LQPRVPRHGRRSPRDPGSRERRTGREARGRRSGRTSPEARAVRGSAPRARRRLDRAPYLRRDSSGQVSGAPPPGLRVRWHPPDFPLRDAAEAVLRDSIRELGLTEVVRDVHVHVDLRNRDDHAYIEWNTHDHRAARLSFALGNFVTPARRRAWARTWGRRAGTPPVLPRQFSRKNFAEACLHEL